MYDRQVGPTAASFEHGSSGLSGSFAVLSVLIRPIRLIRVQIAVDPFQLAIIRFGN